MTVLPSMTTGEVMRPWKGSPARLLNEVRVVSSFTFRAVPAGMVVPDWPQAAAVSNREASVARYRFMVPPGISEFVLRLPGSRGCQVLPMEPKLSGPPRGRPRVALDPAGYRRGRCTGSSVRGRSPAWPGERCSTRLCRSDDGGHRPWSPRGLHRAGRGTTPGSFPESGAV